MGDEERLGKAELLLNLGEAPSSAVNEGRNAVASAAKIVREVIASHRNGADDFRRGEEKGYARGFREGKAEGERRPFSMPPPPPQIVERIVERHVYLERPRLPHRCSCGFQWVEGGLVAAYGHHTSGHRCESCGTRAQCQASRAVGPAQWGAWR
jgi:hypothetical protein